MFILAQGGATYARLRFAAGPGGEIELPVEVHYAYEFPGSDFDAWDEEYLAGVHTDFADPRRFEDLVDPDRTPRGDVGDDDLPGEEDGLEPCL